MREPIFEPKITYIYGAAPVFKQQAGFLDVSIEVTDLPALVDARPKFSRSTDKFEVC